MIDDNIKLCDIIFRKINNSDHYFNITFFDLNNDEKEFWPKYLGYDIIFSINTNFSNYNYYDLTALIKIEFERTQRIVEYVAKNNNLDIKKWTHKMCYSLGSAFIDNENIIHNIQTYFIANDILQMYSFLYYTLLDFMNLTSIKYQNIFDIETVDRNVFKQNYKDEFKKSNLFE